ncbi:MAG TPA: PDZ domain-containing protein [Gemmatimonadaceae bacterium]|nr:PDZ domain-containing protein [Gemmatimonadaceae bacterium]
MHRLAVIAMAGAMASSGSTLQAQIYVAPQGRAYTLSTQDADRPRLGITTRSSGRRDTLGLLVESVTRDGPAEQAGIEEGDRLVSVNGMNLRLSPLDAGEPDMEGIATRRLQREMAKHNPGDEVELQVYRDGQTRTLRVKTVAARDLETSSVLTAVRGARRDRVVLGVSLGGTGSRRDTLGVLVVGVGDSTPAALAGIEEGDRIAAINGVDLRVAREDAGDWQASSARIRRLNREMEKVEAGDDVELRVYSNGQTRTLRVKAVRAADLPRNAGGFFYYGLPGAVNRIIESFPSPTRVAPRVRVDLDPRVEIEYERRALEEALRSVRAAQARSVEVRDRALLEAQRRLERVQRELRTRTSPDEISGAAVPRQEARPAVVKAAVRTTL